MFVGTLPTLFFNRAAAQGDRVALRYKEEGLWKEVTWSAYAEQAKRAARSLLALGVGSQEPVVILGDNRPEWLICDLATMAVGGMTCGIYPTSSADQVAYILAHSGARVVFAENEEQLDKCLEVRDKVPIQAIVVWDRRGLWGFEDHGVMFFDQFMERGEGVPKETVTERLRAIQPEDTAVLIYTSGTTGPPKGAMLTHRNLVFLAGSLSQANPVGPADQVLSYLPLCHIYERLLSLVQAVHAGYTVNFVESMDTLFQNLREVSPTVFGSVPRIWEKLASQIDLMIADSTWLKRMVYRASIRAGRAVIRARQNGSPAPMRKRLLYALLGPTVLWNLRRLLGFERVRLALCGAAPASPDVFEFYLALGVPLHEGYGMTESTGVISVQRLGDMRRGTVGEALEGVEIRIAADGEILARGPNVFKGYFKDLELTSQTVMDGWLHTGDIGKLENGALSILDRKKDILITAGGKNITPSYIENKLKFSPYIQDAVVVGDGRKYLVALILIEEDNVTRFAQEQKISFTTFTDLTQNEAVRKLIEREIDAINRSLSSVESIKKFALLPRRLYEEEGDVTPTKKVKRKALEKKYKDLIEGLYGG
ncbi:MAG: AMP-binding protein [Nitrospirae bacterium]|nr:AMP-binding protein [Nitrospirota bacterium]